MQANEPSYFEQMAATWDVNPVIRSLVEAVVEAILRQVQVTSRMAMLDYGCGTGLVSFLMAKHVATVTAADSSEGMLAVLRKKIAASDATTIRAVPLDLERDSLPDDRYDLIVVNMVMHHVADTEKMLRNFYSLLRPGGTLCISDLDTEPAIFHDAQAAPTVRHFGFDRECLLNLLGEIGYLGAQHTTAHVVRKPIASGEERDFPIFLLTARR